MIASQYVYLVEYNIHGAVVIYGALGVKQYYYYVPSEAIASYIDECRRTYIDFGKLKGVI